MLGHVLGHGVDLKSNPECANPNNISRQTQKTTTSHMFEWMGGGPAGTGGPNGRKLNVRVPGSAATPTLKTQTFADPSCPINNLFVNHVLAGLYRLTRNCIIQRKRFLQ
jgi:hypothetical protein